MNGREQIQQERVTARGTSISPRRRSWVSVLLSVALIGMLVTGVLSYVLPYSPDLSGMHTWFGIAFSVAIVWHLLNNLRSLTGYLKNRLGKKQLAVGSLVSVVIIVGVFAAFPPFSSVLDFGHKLKQVKGVEAGSYQTLFTRSGETGLALTIELRAGDHYESPPQPLFLGLSYRSTPQMVFWTEDLTGNYLETLYVTKKVATSNFRTASFSDTSLKRRPESLPYWSHKRGVVDDDGLMVPLANNQDLDGVTGATPVGHYDINTVARSSSEPFRLLMEINRSYDFNDYYSRDRFPDDPVYSGSGSSGQPSVVYAVTIIPSDTKQFYILEAVGHGHHSGQDGKLYADMSGLDSALELVERVVVGVPAIPEMLSANQQAGISKR